MKKTNIKVDEIELRDGDHYIMSGTEEYKLGEKPAKWADRIKVGSELEITHEGDFISFFKDVNATTTAPSKDGGNFLGDDYVTHKELLSAAHKKFKELSITTELVEANWEKQHAVVKATVTTGTDHMKGVFTGLGDCSPANTPNKNIQTAFIRMAETRAVNRALRFATNIGKTSVEELPEMEEQDLK